MPLPRDLAPMLATPGALPADDDAWAYEVKWDGVRVLVAVEDGAVRLTSRNGNDVTGAYPELRGLAGVVEGPVLLDGEVVALDEAGVSDFGLLQSRMHVRGPDPALVRAVPVTLVAFDHLHDSASLLRRAVRRAPGPAGGPAADRPVVAGVPGVPRRRRGGGAGDQGAGARGRGREAARQPLRAGPPQRLLAQDQAREAAERGRRRLEARRGRPGRPDRVAAARGAGPRRAGLRRSRRHRVHAGRAGSSR